MPFLNNSKIFKSKTQNHFSFIMFKVYLDNIDIRKD